MSITKLKPKPQDVLTHLIRQVRSQDYPYQSAEEKPIVWSSYDLAQTNEIADYLILVRDIVDEIRREIGDIDQGHEGQQPTSCFDLAKAILVQQYFETSNRVTAGVLRVLNLNLQGPVSYKALERAYENPNVLLVMRLLFEKTQEPVRHLEKDFTGDGTGVPSSIKQNYESDKGDVKKVALYDMMIGVMGTTYGFISAVEVVKGPVDENPFIKPLLEETRERYDRIDSFSYDAAGYAYNTIQYISRIGAVPYIFPHVNASLNSCGCLAKKKMLLAFIEETQQWMQMYHKRSLNESRHSADKRVFTRPTLRRIDCRRLFEGYTRACRYNLRRLVYVHYLNGLPVKWLSAKGF